jgi:uncharacterized membrane protein YdbT with pleckstrin-like domain
MITLEKEEHIILEIRKHWFFLAVEVALAIIFILLPILLFPILSFIGFEIDVSSISLTLFIYFLWVLFIWLTIFIFWTNYYLDVWLVTNHKIYDIEQHDLFKREVSVLHYEKIQDITYEINGFIPSILNLGNLHIQTAGTERNFTIKGIKDPAYVQKKVNEILLKRKINKESV